MGKKEDFGYFGFPSKLSGEELIRIYNSNVPRADNFLNKGKRIRLSRFTAPFKGHGGEVAAKFGRNLDTPFYRNFEEQLDEFVMNTIDNHWSKQVPMKGGMIKVLKRMGRAGALYRHGFNPKSPKQQLEEGLEIIENLESEIKRDRMVLGKRVQFEEERDIKREEALGRFYELPQEDRYKLEEEYDCAKTNPKILIRGGKFEDFLIYKFSIKIKLFEEIKENYRIRMRLVETIAALKELSHKRSNNQIDTTEFVRIYKASEIELNKLDSELKNMHIS